MGVKYQNSNSRHFFFLINYPWLVPLYSVICIPCMIVANIRSGEDFTQFFKLEQIKQYTKSLF